MTKTEDMATFTAKRVVEYMKILHISVNKLQQDTGMARTTITRYMKGKTMPSLYFLGKFLDYIEIGVAEFYEPYIVNNKEFDSLHGGYSESMGKFQIDALIQGKTKTCFVEFKKEHCLKENILNCVACMEYDFQQRVMQQLLCGTFYTKGLALIDEFKAKVEAAVLPEKIEPGWLYCVEMNSYSIKLVVTWVGKGALQGVKDNFVRLSVAAKVLSLKEYGKLYDISPNTVRQLIRKGYITNPLKQEKDWMLSEIVVPPLLKKQRPMVRQYEAITTINGYVGKLQFLNSYDYIRIEKDMKNTCYSKITLWKRKMEKMEAPLVMHLEEEEKATLELSLITDQNIIGEDGNAVVYVLAA